MLYQTNSPFVMYFVFSPFCSWKERVKEKEHDKLLTIHNQKCKNQDNTKYKNCTKLKCKLHFVVVYF